MCLVPVWPQGKQLVLWVIMWILGAGVHFRDVECS